MDSGVEVEEVLLEVLREQALTQFQEKLTLQKQLTRLDHFQHVTDDELLVSEDARSRLPARRQ